MFSSDIKSFFSSFKNVSNPLNSKASKTFNILESVVRYLFFVCDYLYIYIYIYIYICVCMLICVVLISTCNVVRMPHVNYQILYYFLIKKKKKVIDSNSVFSSFHRRNLFYFIYASWFLFIFMFCTVDRLVVSQCVVNWISRACSMFGVHGFGF